MAPLLCRCSPTRTRRSVQCAARIPPSRPEPKTPAQVADFGHAGEPRPPALPYTAARPASALTCLLVPLDEFALPRARSSTKSQPKPRPRAARTRCAGELAAPSHPKPRCWPKWITHNAYLLPDLSPARIEPRSTKIGELRRTSTARRRGEGSPSTGAGVPRAQPALAVRSRMDARD